MNDREKCEVSFISRCVHMITIAGMKYTKNDDANKISNIAYESAIEPFIECDERRKKSLIRRVIRMQDKTINKMIGNYHGEEVLLTLYFFIEKLIEMDYLIIPENSKLRIIVDYLLSLIDINSKLTNKRLKSAKKQADKWMEILKNEGYYA